MRLTPTQLAEMRLESRCCNNSLALALEYIDILRNQQLYQYRALAEIASMLPIQPTENSDSPENYYREKLWRCIELAQMQFSGGKSDE